ncbi:MAG: CBS domain-containing protein [Peptococcaceae bacterium]|nr:CBS domain-containing protein [Peptococcaceae bacterium]
MPHDKSVKDLMLPLADCPAVSPDDTVQRAVTLLKKGAVSGHQFVLVMNDSGQPVGLLSRRALLRILEPKFVVTDRWALPVFWNGFFTDKCKEEAKKKVKDIMRPINVLTVETDDPITKALHIMVSNHIGILPVLKDGKVVGVLRLHEIFQEFAGLVADPDIKTQPVSRNNRG